MHTDTATCLAGTENGRWELGVMNGIGVMLGLKAEAVEAVIARADFALKQRCRSLDAGLASEDLHHATGAIVV